MFILGCQCTERVNTTPTCSHCCDVTHMARACGIHKNTPAATLDSLGGLSPNTSGYIHSLWYHSGAKPVLALSTGKGSSRLKLHIAGKQQKTPSEGVHVHTPHYFRWLESQVGCCGPQRESSGQGSSLSWLQNEMQPAPTPICCDKINFCLDHTNFATFKSSKKQLKGNRTPNH